MLAQGRMMTLAAEKICGPQPACPQNRLLLSDVYSYRACILHDGGQIEEAGNYFLKQVKIRRDHLIAIGKSATIVDGIQLATAYNNLAGIYCSLNKFEQSIMRHEL
jgi:tetratricopeptide (TPR) repeat protein